MPRENLRWRRSEVEPTDTSEHHLLQDGGREAQSERLKKRFKSRKQGEMLSSKIREVGFSEVAVVIIKCYMCQTDLSMSSHQWSWLSDGSQRFDLNLIAVRIANLINFS